jgi:uncharacterized protein (DUF2252 family)
MKRPRGLGIAVAVALCAAGCSGVPSPPLGEEEAAVVATAKPIAHDDFARPVDRAAIRATQRHLDDAAFVAKWDASRESAVLFMRSYPAAYHADLAQVSAKKLLGEEGLCFGDAHPDNFGFVRIGGRTQFVFNDLDDAGYCPIALDAARYFAVLRLYFDDGGLTKRVLGQYADTVEDAGRARAIDDDRLPDWSKVATKELAEHVRSGKLVLAGEVSAATTAERSAIEATVRGDARLGVARVLDVAAVARTAGGSGGLRRYWVLAERGGAETILELKEAAAPGVEAGRHAKTLGMDERLATLKDALWSTSAADDYVYAQVLGARFLVRDRLAKKSVKLDELGHDAREDVLRAQASVMARLHAPRWKGVDKDELRRWLDDSSKVLAERWARARDAGR